MTFKGAVFRTSQIGDYIFTYEEQLATFFHQSLENKLLSEYIDHPLNGEKSIKIKHILVNNRTS